MTVPGIITRDQLREEVGGATTDTRAAGHLTDDMLDGIIERYATMFSGLVRDRLAQRGSTLGLETEEVSVTLATDAVVATVASGTMPGTHVPWASVAVDGDGNALDLDPDLFQTVENSPFPRRRFMIAGDTLYASPETVTSVSIHVPHWGSAIDALAGDLLLETNERIVRATREMLASRIAEQTRLLRSDMQE